MLLQRKRPVLYFPAHRPRHFLILPLRKSPLCQNTKKAMKVRSLKIDRFRLAITVLLAMVQGARIPFPISLDFLWLRYERHRSQTGDPGHEQESKIRAQWLRVTKQNRIVNLLSPILGVLFYQGQVVMLRWRLAEVGFLMRKCNKLRDAYPDLMTGSSKPRAASQISSFWLFNYLGTQGCVIIIT